MTTPVPDAVDWLQVLPMLQDAQSVRFVQRLVESQRQMLDTQVAQLNELSKQLEEHLRGLEGGKPQGTSAK